MNRRLAPASFAAVALALLVPLASAVPASGADDRSGWVATASAEGFGYPASHLLDGDAGTLWSTGAGQVPGQWLQLDLGAARTFMGVALTAGAATADYPRAWSVTTSTDGIAWTAPVTGAGALADGVTRVSLGEVRTARYVRIEQTSGHFINAWSAAELTLLDEDYSFLDPWLSPAESVVTPGQSVALTLAGWFGAEPVSVTGPGIQADAVVDAQGRGTATVVAPPGAASGSLALVATGETSGREARAVVAVHAAGEPTDPDPNADACAVDPDPGEGPSESPEPTPVTLTAPSCELVPGSSYTIEAAGLGAGTYRLELHSTVRLLAQPVVSAPGTFAVRVTIPSDVEAGAHELHLLDAAGETIAVTAVTIAAVPAAEVDPAPALSSTGLDGAGIAAIALASVIAAAGGLALLAMRRRLSR